MIAGIILYNPNYQRLCENIDAIVSQVDTLVFFDNGIENVGVATALNQICKYAKEHGEEWVLCLDQDSVCPENIIEEYQKYTSDTSIAMICPKIKDRNYDDNDDDNDDEIYVNSCITSGSMIRISAWEEVGGFCEDYFIDNVDFDMCLMLRKKGYKILQTKAVTLLHEIGHSMKVRFMGNDWMLFNHNPQRCYYIIRNTILLGRRHGMILKSIYRSLLRVLVINIYEHNRIAKNRMMLKAYWHALTGHYGR